MVRIAGLEPANCVFSLLLIIAFLHTDLLVLIRVFARYYKCFVAIVGNREQQIVCQAVSDKSGVSALCLAEFCVRFVSGSVS